MVRIYLNLPIFNTYKKTANLLNISYLKLFKVICGNYKKQENKIADVVKIDEGLLKKVKNLIKKNSMKIKYSNVKQFVNIAVLEKLEKEVRKK